MISRVLALALLAALASLAVPGAARAYEVDTILRRPAEESVHRVALGPTRQQGDFAVQLGELLAAAAPESSAAPEGEPAPTVEREERQPPVVLPILGGIAGGAIGLYGGAVLGLALASDNGGDEWEDIAIAVTSGFVGEVALMPLGVHLGNARKGSYGIDLAVSFFSGLAGIGLLGLLGSSPYGAIAGAGLQLTSVVLAERAKGRHRIAERAADGTP